METEILDLIQSVGFPIAVSLWFMFRMERVIKSNTSVLEKVCVLISKKK